MEVYIAAAIMLGLGALGAAIGMGLLGGGKNRIDLRYLLIYLLGSLEIKSKVISSLGL